MALRDLLAPGDRAWLRSCDRVAARSRLRGRPVIRNGGRIEIGADFQLSSHPIPSHLVTWPGAELIIGDDVAIAHGAAIACKASVRIGDNTRIGPFLVLADSDFHSVGDRHREPPARAIVIGKGVRIGARVNVLPGAVIGDRARVLPGSTVAGIVAEGAIVSGAPARDVRLPAPPGDERPLEARVCALVARVLGLNRPPAVEASPDEVAGWDSLGALRILLAIEDEFSVRLDERELSSLRSIGDWVRLVHRKQDSTGGADVATR